MYSSLSGQRSHIMVLCVLWSCDTQWHNVPDRCWLDVPKYTAA